MDEMPICTTTFLNERVSDHNPCAKGGRVYKAEKRVQTLQHMELTWSVQEDGERMLAKAENRLQNVSNSAETEIAEERTEEVTH